MFFLYTKTLDEKDDGFLKCCMAIEPDDEDDGTNSMQIHDAVERMMIG